MTRTKIKSASRFAKEQNLVAQAQLILGAAAGSLTVDPLSTELVVRLKPDVVRPGCRLKTSLSKTRPNPKSSGGGLLVIFSFWGTCF